MAAYKTFIDVEYNQQRQQVGISMSAPYLPERDSLPDIYALPPETEDGGGYVSARLNRDDIVKLIAMLQKAVDAIDHSHEKFSFRKNWS